jgi:hypothetical protein
MDVLMNAKGIRILDNKDRILSPTLFDILEEVPDGNTIYWYILCLEGIGNQGQDSLYQFEKEINSSINGLFISWNELTLLSDRYFQMFEIVVLGSKNLNQLRRYDSEITMCETCDIVIELIDRTFWEIYSNNTILIARLANKFKDIEFLEIVDGQFQEVEL